MGEHKVNLINAELLKDEREKLIQKLHDLKLCIWNNENKPNERNNENKPNERNNTIII